MLHRDDALWVFNKPANVSLLRDRSGAPDLRHAITEEIAEPYLVHRLDKGTSGVLLVATTQASQSRLTQAFARHEVSKSYIAWVVGQFPDTGTQVIDLPLCRGRKSRYRVAGERGNIEHRNRRYTVPQDRKGVAAVTRARALSYTDTHTLLALRPQHGRTHQLRVHLSWTGYPIVGDHLYGRKSDPLQAAPRLMLHCRSLVILGERFVAPLPREFDPGFVEPG